MSNSTSLVGVNLVTVAPVNHWISRPRDNLIVGVSTHSHYKPKTEVFASRTSKWPACLSGKFTCTLPVSECCNTPMVITTCLPGSTVNVVEFDIVTSELEVELMPPPMEIPSMSTPRLASAVKVLLTVIEPPIVTSLESDPPSQL